MRLGSTSPLFYLTDRNFWKYFCTGTRLATCLGVLVTCPIHESRNLLPSKPLSFRYLLQQLLKQMVLRDELRLFVRIRFWFGHIPFSFGLGLLFSSFPLSFSIPLAFPLTLGVDLRLGSLAFLRGLSSSCSSSSPPLLLRHPRPGLPTQLAHPFASPSPISTSIFSSTLRPPNKRPSLVPP